MTTRRQPHVVSFVLSLVVTLAIFSSVSSLASLDSSTPMLARAAAAQAAHG